MLQHFITCGFSSSCRANKHDSKADVERLKELDDLEQKHRVLLQLEMLNRLLNLSLQLSIVRFCDFNGWEQVLYNS